MNYYCYKVIAEWVVITDVEEESVAFTKAKMIPLENANKIDIIYLGVPDMSSTKPAGPDK